MKFLWEGLKRRILPTSHRLHTLQAFSRLLSERKGEPLQPYQVFTEIVLQLTLSEKGVFLKKEKGSLRIEGISGTFSTHPPQEVLDPFLLPNPSPHPPFFHLPSSHPLVVPFSFRSPSALGILFSYEQETLGALLLDLNPEQQKRVIQEEGPLLAIFSHLLSLDLYQETLIENLKEKNELLKALFLIAREVNKEVNPGKALREILHTAIRYTSATSGSIIFVDPVKQKLKILAQEGLPEEVEKSLVLSIGEGITGWVAKEKKPALVPDVRKDPRYVKAREGVISELAVPIFIGNEVIGVLNVDGDAPSSFTLEDQELLQTLADLVSAKLQLVFQRLGHESESGS